MKNKKGTTIKSKTTPLNITRYLYIYIFLISLFICCFSLFTFWKAYKDNQQIKTLYYGQCFRKPDFFFAQQQWYTFLTTMQTLQKKQTIVSETVLNAMYKETLHALPQKHRVPRRRRKIPTANYALYEKMRIQNRHNAHSYNPLFEWPIAKNKFWLSSLFGPRKKADGSWGFHYAIDLAAVKGTPVKAALSGLVIEAGYSKKGYGRTIVLKHKNRFL